jgi:glycerophosphoryl diester phosphodiesterase
MSNVNSPTPSLPQETHILNIAHRGARAYAPENTLAAFAKAKAFGCDMVELDVRLSKDGEIMVYHDEHLLRCTDAKAKFPNRSSYQIADFTYQELSLLDAGIWYVEQLMLTAQDRQAFLQSLTDAEIAEFISPSERDGYTSGTIKIPTLAQTLSLANELNLLVNIELKKTDEGAKLVMAVIKLVQKMKLADKILVSSFEHDLLKQVRQQTKQIATAVLTDLPLKAPITYLRKLKANACNLGCYHDYQTSGFGTLSGNRYLAQLRKINKANFGLNIWTCNDPAEMAYLLAAGATGIISDYPNRVTAALAKAAQKN